MLGHSDFMIYQVFCGYLYGGSRCRAWLEKSVGGWTRSICYPRPVLALHPHQAKRYNEQAVRMGAW